MNSLVGKRLVLFACILITILLGLNVVLTYRNSIRIEKNRVLHQQSEDIKNLVSKIAIDVIHNLDLGIRSYALFNDEKYLYPFRIALEKKDSILHVIEKILIQQNHPLDEFHVLKDSIESYANLNRHLKELIDAKDHAEFHHLANQDKGYILWLQFEKFANHIYAFENANVAKANKSYSAALKNNYLLQFILFLICIPTLIFTTLHTFKTFRLQTQLREAETERADFLTSQNETLEKKVLERTQEISNKNHELEQIHKEIAIQSEEIISQNEQLIQQQQEILSQRDILTQQNKKLSKAHKIILKQRDQIKEKNQLLEIEVERKTKELVAYNQQLEQFAFTAAHNLRSPVARILGLGNILEYSKSDRKEADSIIQKMINTTRDLDTVVKDLNSILEIKENLNAHLTNINFSEEIKLIKSNLEKEISETKCQIHEYFQDAPSVVSVKPYIDSILYNLISNAIKYRSPERIPSLTLRTSNENNFFCLEVQDNGLGVDLKKYGKDIFSLYKRFHTHTEGKGLGLHLVKMQALALGGYVDVTSHPGEGSTFKVYIKSKSKDVSENPAPIDPDAKNSAGHAVIAT